MNYIARLAVVSAIGAALLGGFSGQAATFSIGEAVSVNEVSVSPNCIVTIYNSHLPGTYNVYAGINNLTVQPTGGTAVALQGFCIDPFHFSYTGMHDGYTVVALENAPKSPSGGGSGMGIDEADQIGTLWGAHFSSGMNEVNAAALQVAIWEIVGGVGLANPIAGLTIKGSEEIMNLANGWVSDVRGDWTPNARANFVGLTHPDTGQDYVVANVPDGGATVVLLGMGLLGLAAAGRQLRFC